MKNNKKAAIALALSTMLTFMPLNYIAYAQTSATQDLYSTIKTKFTPILNVDDMMKAATIFDAVTSNGFSTQITTALSNLSTDSKNLLIQNGFINKSGEDLAINNILVKATDTTALSNILMKIMLGEDSNIDADMLKLATAIYDVFPSEYKSNTFDNYGATKEEKIDFLQKLIKAVYVDGDKMVTEENGALKIKLPAGYITDANAIFAQNVAKGKEPVVLTSAHEAAINAFLDVIAQKINSNANAKQALIDLSTKINAYSATQSSPGSSGGGSSSGGGGGSTTETSTPQEEKKVEASLSNNAVEVAKEGNISVVTVKTAELTKSIDGILATLGNKQALINIELKDIKDLNVKFKLPAGALKKLEGKEATIDIKTDKLQVQLPIKSLDLSNSNANIALDVKEINKNELNSIIKKEIKNVFKAIELDLYKVDGTNVAKIDSKFAKKVKIGIDISDITINKDKAAIVQVKADGTTQVFGGKSNSGKLFASLEHFSKYAVVERDVTFGDMSSHWSKQYVDSMASKDIVNGYDDSTFKPENKVTRAEFAKLLVEALDLDMVNDTNNFNDTKNHWSKDYVETAYKAGLINGYSKDNFAPDNKITRAEMATMIGRALETANKADLSKFADNASIPAWAKEAISKAVAENLVKGDEKGFRSNDNTTRAEATTVIYRLFNK